MKKIYLFWTCCLTMLLLAGCDTELDDINTGYIPFNIKFLPENIANNYKVMFNGSEDKYIPANDVTGILEVFPKESNTPILIEKDITITKEGIALVKPLGKELAVYSDTKYVNIMPKIIFSADASLYSVMFNGNEVTIDQGNYISKDELPGDLKIMEKESSTELYSQELTSEAHGVINIMQLSATEFLSIPDIAEPDPAENAFKVRFFFTADAFPNQDKLIFDFYLCDKKGKNDTFFKSVELEKNQLSEYIEVDNNFLDDGSNEVHGKFDLKDKDGNIIVDHTVNKKALITIGPYGKTYKLLTFRFTNSTPGEGSGARAAGLRDMWIER